MKHAETVTFGGSGLNRAAELRTDTEAMRRMSTSADSRALLMWQGKPLVSGENQVKAARLPLTHPVVAAEAHTAVFLGIDEDTPVFAYDLGDWEPDPEQAQVASGFLGPDRTAPP